jgi:hypothetical protein
LRLSGTATLPKCSARYFTKPAAVIFKGCSASLLLFWRASFLSVGNQRKEAKEKL